MFFFSICYILVFFIAFLFCRKYNNFAKRSFVISVITPLIILCSIRSVWVGTDTLNYLDKFQDAISMSWADIPMRLIERYVLGTEETDVGFILLEKIVASFTSSFQLFTFIVDLLFFVPFGVFLYRSTSNYYQLVFAFVFFISLIYIFILFGTRQMLAMGFELIGFLYITKEKYIKAILITLVGALIHMSMLLCVPFIIACWFFRKWEKLLHALSIALFPIVLLFTQQVLAFMGGIMEMERYKKYGEEDVQGGANVFILMLFLLSLFCFFAIKKKHLKQSEWLQKMYMALPFLTITGPLIHSNGSMIRISLYFFIYLMILVPIAMELSLPKILVKRAYVVSIGALIIMKLLSGGIEYDFFWNDPPTYWNIK